MSRVRTVVVLGVAAVLLLGLVLVVTGRSDRGDGREVSAGPAGQGTGTKAGAGTKPSSEMPQHTGTPKKGSNARSGEPQQPESGRLALPTPTPKGPLVTGPLPRSASGSGRLTPGYPHVVLPAFPGSRVRSSSVSPSGAALQVALVARTSRGQDAVAKFYRLRLARYGFTASPLAAVGGSTAIGFDRGTDSVVLTLTPRGTRACVYSVFGVLHTGAS